MPRSKVAKLTASARAARKVALAEERKAARALRASGKKRERVLTSTARKTRAKRARFNRLKADAIKEVKSFVKAIDAAREKLKAKARLASDAVSILYSAADDAPTFLNIEGNLSSDPQLEDIAELDFDSMLESLADTLEELKAVLK